VAHLGIVLARKARVRSVAMKLRVGLIVWLLVLHSVSAQDRAPQNDSIRKEDLKADLSFLAHDLTDGRLVGTKGYELAAEFVRSRFERLGLVPPGPDGSYFHSFNLAVARRGERPRDQGRQRRLDPTRLGTGLLSSPVRLERPCGG
jgi:hypothetical protein